MIQIIKTKYIGIYVQEENGTFWIVDDNGNDKCFGENKPTENDVDNYRNNIEK